MALCLPPSHAWQRASALGAFIDTTHQSAFTEPRWGSPLRSREVTAQLLPQEPAVVCGQGRAVTSVSSTAWELSPHLLCATHLQEPPPLTCHPAVPVVCPGQHALRERCITAWLRGPSLLPLPHHPLWLLVWDPEAILLFLGPLCKHRKTDSMRADVGWGFPSRWPGCQCRVRLAS